MLDKPHELVEILEEIVAAEEGSSEGPVFVVEPIGGAISAES